MFVRKKITATDALQPHVEAAITRLGTVKPEAARSLASYMADLDWHADVGLGLRRREPQVSPEIKLQLGLSARTKLSVEVYDMLTDRGRERPVEAIKGILLAALFAHTTQSNVAGMIEQGTTHFELSAAHREVCVGCRRLDGVRGTADQLPALPPPDCWRDWCSIVTLAVIEP